MSDNASSPNERPSMATDPEEYMRQFEARTAAMRANATRLQEGLSAANATVASDEGEVSITVGMGGTLQAIEFGPTHRHMSGQGLAQLIMETYHEAVAEASTKSVDVMSDILGEDSEALSIMRQYAQGGGDR
jgi:DNA-binding protein YbaB